MVTFKNWTAMFEWHVVMCGYQKGHQKDKLVKRCAHNLLYVLTSMVNISRGTCMTT